MFRYTEDSVPDRSWLYRGSTVPCYFGPVLDSGERSSVCSSKLKIKKKNMKITVNRELIATLDWYMFYFIT